MSQSSERSANNVEEEEQKEEEEEEEEIWLCELVCAALVGLSVAYTLKCSNISLCLNGNTPVESRQREDGENKHQKETLQCGLYFLDENLAQNHIHCSVLSSKFTEKSFK